MCLVYYFLGLSYNFLTFDYAKNTTSTKFIINSIILQLETIGRP